MKKVNKLVKMQLQIYLKGSGFMMPLIVTGIFLYVMYTIKPLNIISSYLISSTFLFLVMVWVGLATVSGEEPVTEQLLILRMQSPASYYVAKVLFLVCIVLIMDLIYTGFPVIQNMLNGYDMFDRPLLAADVGNAFLLQGGSAFAGAALGSLLHPRVLKDRKLAIVLTVLFAVLTMTKPALITHLPVLKGILWILPPVMRTAELYGNAAYFTLSRSVLLFAECVVYGIGYSVLKSILCQKRKF